MIYASVQEWECGFFEADDKTFLEIFAQNKMFRHDDLQSPMKRHVRVDAQYA